jgi:hypothetical protein
MNMSATFGRIDKLKITKWVDASYAVRDDMKSHTGGYTSLGQGIFLPKSSKQKVNTKSSSEAEVVGTSDDLPHAIWAKLFLTAQDYNIMIPHVLYQDNLSAIHIEKNGCTSASHKSQHINIRFSTQGQVVH